MITATFTLLSPLSHSAFGAEAGNAVPLRRFPLVSLPDAPRIPAVSGNALRGVLRRSLMRELLSALEIDSSAEHWDRIYSALANGGTIERAEKQLEPERIRRVRDALPALSVLGSALYTWLLPGHVQVGIAWPVCRETVAAGLVPGEEGRPGAGELEEEYSASRLPDADRISLERAGTRPMPVTIEALSTGTCLVSRICFARHAPAVERAAIAHGLTLLDHLGGKSGQGLGAVALSLDGSEPDANPGLYRMWLADESMRSRARDAVLALPDTW